MSPEEKAKRSKAARLRFIPIRNGRQMLFDLMVEGLSKVDNQISADEKKLLLTEAAKLQVSWKLGPSGNVEIKDRKTGETRMEFKNLSWSKLAIDEQADILRAIRNGKSVRFDYLEDGEVQAVEEDEDEQEAA